MFKVMCDRCDSLKAAIPTPSSGRATEPKRAGWGRVGVEVMIEADAEDAKEFPLPVIFTLCPVCMRKFIDNLLVPAGIVLRTRLATAGEPDHHPAVMAWVQQMREFHRECVAVDKLA